MEDSQPDALFRASRRGDGDDDESHTDNASTPVPMRRVATISHVNLPPAFTRALKDCAKLADEIADPDATALVLAALAKKKRAKHRVILNGVVNSVDGHLAAYAETDMHSNSSRSSSASTLRCGTDVGDNSLLATG